jgi:hypothetical protein
MASVEFTSDPMAASPDFQFYAMGPDAVRFFWTDAYNRARPMIYPGP